MARPQQLAAFFLTVAFAVGAALGWTAGRVMVPRAEAAAPVATGAPGDRTGGRDGGRGWERGGEARMLDAFTRELDLTAAQRAAVDSILDERRRIMDSLMTPLRPRLDAARDEARAQIRQRLTPEQQVKFGAYLERMRTGGPGAPHQGATTRGAAAPR